jgi:hypothetical protein
MAGVTAALTLGSAALSAYGSYQKGKAEKEQAEANAQIYDAQAKNIREAQKITAGQFRTQGNVLRGQATADAARNGLKISGTTASSISQSIMQLQMDNAYQQFNLEAKRINAMNNAALQRYQGKMAYRNGLMEAGKTALTAGIDYKNKYWKGFNNPFSKKERLSGGFDISNEALFYGQPMA